MIDINWGPTITGSNRLRNGRIKKINETKLCWSNGNYVGIASLDSSGNLTVNSTYQLGTVLDFGSTYRYFTVGDIIVLNENSVVFVNGYGKETRTQDGTAGFNNTTPYAIAGTINDASISFGNFRNLSVGDIDAPGYSVHGYPSDHVSCKINDHQFLITAQLTYDLNAHVCDVSNNVIFVNKSGNVSGITADKTILQKKNLVRYSRNEFVVTYSVQYATNAVQIYSNMIYVDSSVVKAGQVYKIPGSMVNEQDHGVSLLDKKYLVKNWLSGANTTPRCSLKYTLELTPNKNNLNLTPVSATQSFNSTTEDFVGSSGNAIVRINSTHFLTTGKIDYALNPPNDSVRIPPNYSPSVYINPLDPSSLLASEINDYINNLPAGYSTSGPAIFLYEQLPVLSYPNGRTTTLNYYINNLSTIKTDHYPTDFALMNGYVVVIGQIGTGNHVLGSFPMNYDEYIINENLIFDNKNISKWNNATVNKLNTISYN